MIRATIASTTAAPIAADGFWVGTMNERRDATSGALYRLDGYFD